MSNRLAALRSRLAERELDALLVASPANRRYLSGFTGTAGLLAVTADEALLFTDFRYTEQATAEAPGFEVIRHDGSDLLPTLAGRLSAQGVRRVGFESAYLTIREFEKWREALAGFQLVPQEGLVEELRIVKDPAEIEAIRRSMAVADAAWQELIPEIRPGLREEELALELEYKMRRKGASGRSFDFIVASGPRSSLPHGVATDRVLQSGDLVTFDFGCLVDGYASDMTRTIVLGEPDARQREIYQIVLEAQLAGLAAVRAGADSREVDAAARDIIAQAGYGEYFGHSLGHGLGLEVHEAPRLSPQGDTVTLEAGMVVTVEPGIYLPGWGGVRIEDTVVVTEQGSEVLCQATKELISL